MTKPTFIEINPKQDKIDLIKKYQEDTDTKVMPAQDAMALINLMVYYANLVKSQMNDAACLNLVEFSRYPFIDFLGAYKNCKRTSASKGYDNLKIKLNTTFSYDITINKGLQVKSSDSEEIFETIDDLTIPAGERDGIVKIESQRASSDINKYKAGEINEVISSSYSYIEGVVNLNGVEGGSDAETDEDYAQRIMLAPEGYSVAGPEAAYIYFVKSAHSSITDVTLETPDESITIEINGKKAEMVNNTASNSVFDAEADFMAENVEITLNQSLDIEDKIKVRVPHPFKIIIYILTENGVASQTILDIVKDYLEPVRPLSDYVIYKSAEVREFEISGTVYLKPDADSDVVKNNVKSYLTNYIQTRKNKLNKDVVLNKIITEVCKIDGVYDFKPTSPTTTLLAEKYITYTGSLGAIDYVRVGRDD